MKRNLNTFWGAMTAANGAALLLVSVYYVFNLSAFGFLLQANSYLYLLLGLGLWQVFIVYPTLPARPERTFMLDVGLALASLAVCAYFSWHGRAITAEGWMLMPPNTAVVWLSGALCALVVEALRRVAGILLAILCAFFVLFPMFADQMPAFLLGNNFSAFETLTMHALDSQSLVGIPLTVTGTLLMGYIMFGVVLKQTGGGQFFLDIASALMGRHRGGAGKIAVVASSMFGSMSGSSVSNVITTGSVTIPAMKKTGFPAHQAGAIEACASTGGMVMPPVMGAVAFLMAQFLGVSYFTVVIAAVIPSLLYYFGLLVTLDSRAARQRIVGLPASQLPRVSDVLKGGWPFLGALLTLIYLLYLQLEAQAPFWSTLVVLATVIGLSRTRLGRKDLVELLADISISVSELIATLAAVGFIIGAMSFTGVGIALSGELVSLAGNNPYILLAMGAMASFVLGMGMTTSACYIFLAVVLAPGLVTQGFNELAVHLFILYWAIASNITPPVALACFPAARIAESSYFKVGFAAVGFGFVTYVVPFAFVINPALILEGSPLEVISSLVFAVLGVALAAVGIGGRAPIIGQLPVAASVVLVIAGVVTLLSPDVWVEMTAVAVALFTSMLARLSRRQPAAANTCGSRIEPRGRGLDVGDTPSSHQP